MNILSNKKIDIKGLKDISNLPKSIFESPKSQHGFWDDEHISKQMLNAHLNPNWDAASRNHKTIDFTCEWINSIINIDKKIKLLDLGCGPGLYCSNLYDMGMSVTGIDYSKRSIEYAKEQAKLSGHEIQYIYKDYLKINYNQEYDVAIMIYCDFGVLSYENRNKLLKNIHNALKDGGYFIFDVWSTKNSELRKEYKDWQIHKEAGFWRATPYIELINKKYYESEDVSLKQHVIINDTGETDVHNLWEQLYTSDSIKELLCTNGFELIDIYSDLTGKAFEECSELLGVVARKII